MKNNLNFLKFQLDNFTILQKILTDSNLKLITQQILWKLNQEKKKLIIKTKTNKNMRTDYFRFSITTAEKLISFLFFYYFL